jgi:DNA processing protein
MEVNKVTQNANGFPARLQQIATAPKELYIRGAELAPLLERPCVAVVGSRKVSAYGKAVTAQLVRELAQHGVVIVSGLALGVDAIAHQAALDGGGQTIAVLPCGLERVYPLQHFRLARDILAQGGALVSEYPPGAVTYPLNFVARNRIVSGLSDAVLITEAAEKSGTLHTARFALEQGREVLAVPGSITSVTSAGTNNLIKTGATPVTCTADIFHALGLEPTAARRKRHGDNPHEQRILDLIYEGMCEGAELLANSKLSTSEFNQTLTMLEITGKIRALGNNQWAVY